METMKLFTQQFPDPAASYHDEGLFLPHGRGRVAVGPELLLESQTTAYCFNLFQQFCKPPNTS